MTPVTAASVWILDDKNGLWAQPLLPGALSGLGGAAEQIPATTRWQGQAPCWFCCCSVGVWDVNSQNPSPQHSSKSHFTPWKGGCAHQSVLEDSSTGNNCILPKKILPVRTGIHHSWLCAAPMAGVNKGSTWHWSTFWHSAGKMGLLSQ